MYREAYRRAWGSGAPAVQRALAHTSNVMLPSSNDVTGHAGPSFETTLPPNGTDTAVAQIGWRVAGEYQGQLWSPTPHWGQPRPIAGGPEPVPGCFMGQWGGTGLLALSSRCLLGSSGGAAADMHGAKILGFWLWSRLLAAATTTPTPPTADLSRATTTAGSGAAPLEVPITALLMASDLPLTAASRHPSFAGSGSVRETCVCTLKHDFTKRSPALPRNALTHSRAG